MTQARCPGRDGAQFGGVCGFRSASEQPQNAVDDFGVHADVIQNLENIRRHSLMLLKAVRNECSMPTGARRLVPES